MRKNRIAAWLIVISMLFSMFFPGLSVSYADGGTNGEPAGYVTLSVEKFTLGQGYVSEPVKVPFYEGENGAALITQFLGEGNYDHTGNIESSFYLAAIKDNDTSEAHVPQYILDQAGSIDSRAEEGWLGQFDYTPMSGWMYAVNNEFLSYGFSNYYPHNGDVIRTQFTVYGYGADLGGGFEGSYIQPADKDALTAEVAEINSSPDKDALLSRSDVRSAYDQAYGLLTNMESSQGDVNAAYVTLTDALTHEEEQPNLEQPDTEKPVIHVEGMQHQQEVLDSDISFSVTVTDNVYHDIIPQVTLKGVVIPQTDGAYKVSLSPGANTIHISAVDGAGNQADEDYVVTYTVSTAQLAKEQLDKSLAYILQTVDNPKFGTSGGEWSVLSLARGNYPVPNDYYKKYYDNVVTVVQDKKNELDKTKWTEHSRLVLGLTAIGKDVTDVGGYSQLDKLADFNSVIKQGINGPIFALIAFDSQKYEIPVVNGVPVQTTRDMLISYILDREVKKGTENAGGWALGVTTADTDITGMAIQALAPYYGSREDVRAAVDRAVSWLSNAQNAEGSYTSWGSTSSESISQVVTALSSIGIDSDQDSRFIKNGHSLLSALLTFGLPNGGFMHAKPSGNQVAQPNGMATDQAAYALVAYDRLTNHQNRLYDMTDVEGASSGVPTENISVPNGGQNFNLVITAADASKEFNIAVSEAKEGKVVLQLPRNTYLPQVKAVKGTVSSLIPRGAQMTSGDGSALEILTFKDIADQELKNKIEGIIPNNSKLDKVEQAFTIGGQKKVEFNQYVTLTFTGLKGRSAAYIQEGVPYAIQKFASNTEGINSGKSEFAYDSGNDLIVKTKHFTDYIAYASSTIETPGGNEGGSNGGGGSGGGTAPQPKQYATLSVDKLTINKGYVVSPTKVELKSGDTAWSVLQRVLESKGISYDYTWTEKYGSVYVESIAGDGEFDHGSGSGWMYNVNGTYPGYGASKYTLSDGDRIEWRYTTNLGEDLGEDLSQWEPDQGGTSGGGAIAPGIVINKDDKTPVINVPSNIQSDYTLNITKALQNTNNITVNIPDVKAKVILNLEDVKDNIPTITAIKGSTSIVIDKGTRVKSGDRKVEVLTSNQDSKIKELIQETLTGQDRLDSVKNAFVVGNASTPVVVDKPVTLILKGAEGQLPGFIDNGKFTPIKVHDSEEQGAAAVKGNETQLYAFVKGNDLYIKTNRLTSFATYTVTQASVKPETDLNQLYADASSISAWAYEAIREATKQGFIQGSNGKFNPKTNITRAEFAKILVNVLGLDTKNSQVSNFKDVHLNDWFYPYVQAANQTGIMTGYNNEFHPNENITREEMAVTTVRALGVQPSKVTTAIKDINKASAWARTDIGTVSELGLMTGSDNQFLPKGVVTREMAAVVSARVYEFKKTSKPETNGGQTGNPEDQGNQTVNQPDKQADTKVKQQLKDTEAFLQKSVTDPTIATVGGDWTIMGLARSGIPQPDAYYAKYYANVEKILKEKSGKLHSVKYTEYDRVILALTAIGKDVDQVAGYNLRESLADFDTVIKQGINGPIFALIALDSKHYDIPVVKGVKTQTTRELLIDFILKREISGGGWALGERPDAADPDITAMVIQGLTPYYASNPQVKASVDRGIAWLSKAQSANGEFTSWESSNSESAAQVIVALSGLGINPDTDARFIKNGKSVVDALLGYAAPGGGFYHVKSGGKDNGGAKPGEVDLMATDQAMYALVAFDRMANGQNRLYDMTDVK
ncbi:DUF4430 domain-containing protein [Paenibacillus sp. HJL G12]|uniref:DUF4430 domain-containing protein n=1 Tax=Paenibacillus dendrobii TaxID=2691084 RepID=A0A7X3LIN7_9BACL|nr:S-layer homology domain-containing protein [Paenibacillus dendrobii]MWV47181.1 DUF4430 domain-containing protein [Paenibacillus dendrobii]